MIFEKLIDRIFDYYEKKHFGDSIPTISQWTYSVSANTLTPRRTNPGIIAPTSVTLGVTGTATGSLLFKGTTSGTITVKSADVAGTWTLTLPATAGTSGYVLSTDGSGVTSWVSAGNASTVTVSDDTTTNSTMYPLWVSGTGSPSVKISSTKISFNPSTGLLTSIGFSGPLTGNVTGNVSGSSGSCTGNAATATALQTGRTINGVTFDGTANITVTAAAGTLTGTVLNSTVVTSSLTSVGTIATGVWNGTPVTEIYGGTNQSSYALGDTLYASATNTISKLAGNITTTQKFLSQTGDGSASLAPSWQTIPSAGLATYFFYSSTASSIATYFVEKVTASVASASVKTFTGIGTGDATLENYATLVGFPNITFLPPGVTTFYITARQSGGTKTTQLFGELYQRTSGGTETLLSTTAKTIVLTSVDAAYIFQGSIPTGVIFLNTDRIVSRIRVTGGSGGSAATVVLTTEDNTAARCELPAATVDATNFVPYSGATANIDIGSFNLTTTGTITGSQLISTVAIGTAPLVVTSTTQVANLYASTAPAGTLTGTTLNSTVVTSSLTQVGTIAGGIWRGTTVEASHGGTGIVNDIASTWGISGAYATVVTVTNTTAVTLPVSGTLYGTKSGSITSNQLLTSLTDPTGTGVAVFANTPTLTTAVLGSSTATTQPPATNNTTVATTAYVDAAVLGQNFKEAAKYATTAALPAIVYNNGSSGVGATLTAAGFGAVTFDGITPSVGDRVLVKNQVSTFQNGIYTVTVVGGVATLFVLTRSTDANQTNEFRTGDSLFVTSGNTLASTTWSYNGVDTPVMGTDAITYTQTAGQGTVTAGNGITVTGLSVAIDTSVTVDKTTAQTLTNKTLDTSIAKGTWTTSGTWTLPAHTLGGTVSGGGNNLNNIIIGAVTPLAGSFTTVTASTSATTPLIIGGTAVSSTLTLQSTSGVGTTDSILFKVGNNGATTALTMNDNGTSTFGSNAVTMGALTATTGNFSGQINATATSGTAALLSRGADINIEASDMGGANNIYITVKAATGFIATGKNGTGTLQPLRLGVNDSTAVLTLNTDSSATFAAGITATTGTFSGTITSTTGNNTVMMTNSTPTTGWLECIATNNTSGSFSCGIEGSSAGTIATNTLAYAGFIRAYTNTAMQIITNGAVAMTVLGGGNVGIGTTAPSTLLHVGLAGTTLGTIGLAGNISGLITINGAATAGTWTLTLPATAGSSGQFLKTDGSGVTSWAAAGGGGTRSTQYFPINNTNAGWSENDSSGTTTWNSAQYVRLKATTTSGNYAEISQIPLYGTDSGNTFFIQRTNILGFHARILNGNSNVAAGFTSVVVGRSNPTAGTTTVTTKHYGFYVVRAASANVLYASQADGTTESRTDVTSGQDTTLSNFFQCIVTNSTNIKYYIAGSLLATKTSNYPTAIDDTSVIDVFCKTIETTSNTVQLDLEDIFHSFTD